MFPKPRARTNCPFCFTKDEPTQMRHYFFSINVPQCPQMHTSKWQQAPSSQIGPATTLPTETVAGQTSQRSRQIGWLVLCARWRLQITRKHRGEKTGWERVTGGRRGFSESSLPFFSGQIGHRGKLRHSRNGLIRDVLDDLWLACPSFFWLPLQVYKRLTVPSRPIVNHHPSQSHCDLHDVYF